MLISQLVLLIIIYSYKGQAYQQMSVKKMSSMLHKVFVYGTLKKTEANHYWLTSSENGNATFLTNAKTKYKYPLVIGTRYNIPFLLNQPGTGKFVSGEVYEVDDDMLFKLDILEDHPNFYKRELNDVTDETSETSINCWIYLLHTFPPAMLDKTYLQRYTGAPPNPPYIERSQRISNVIAKNDLNFIS